MNIVVIDAQGGGIGRAIVERLRAALPNAQIIAAGTNAAATASMLKAGAHVGTTGENAIIYNCAHSDLIVGPIGIVLANSMYGEITPNMAAAVSGSEAELVLIPASKCQAHIVGLEERPLARHLEEATALILRLCHELSKKEKGT